jgi:hypothetical protein
LHQPLDELFEQCCLAHSPAADDHLDLFSAECGREPVEIFKPVDA